MPWSPLRSLAGQFVLILIGALLLSQLLNIFLLIGERRIVARASHLDAVIERITEEATRLPDVMLSDLPLPVLEGRGFSGVMFLSENNRAVMSRDAKPMRRYERKLADALERVGVPVLSVGVVTRPFRANPARNRPPPEGGRRGAPPFRPRGPPPGGNRPSPGMEESVLSVEIAPGIFLNTLAPVYAAETITSRALLSTGLVLAIAILAALMLARRVARPMQQLAESADTVARGGEAAPVAETGPPDVRAAARAFNSMQRRLTRVIDDQRRTLRAVGHDLRTPITSLRIRAEGLPDEHGRDRFIASLDELATMTDEILRWARDTASTEALAPLRLDTLLDSIAQDYEDRGLPVQMIQTTVDVAVPCRRVSLKRSIVNLVDNALSYGESATLSLSEDASSVRIVVEDNGPGIPDAQLEEVFEPFTRLESSRNRATGGIGLGLSIARSVVQAHGGRLTLDNRAEGGLRATISLPKAVSADDVAA